MGSIVDFYSFINLKLLSNHSQGILLSWVSHMGFNNIREFFCIPSSKSLKVIFFNESKFLFIATDCSNTMMTICIVRRHCLAINSVESSKGSKLLHLTLHILIFSRIQLEKNTQQNKCVGSFFSLGVGEKWRVQRQLGANRPPKSQSIAATFVFLIPSEVSLQVSLIY